MWGCQETPLRTWLERLREEAGPCGWQGGAPPPGSAKASLRVQGPALLLRGHRTSLLGLQLSKVSGSSRRWPPPRRKELKTCSLVHVPKQSGIPQRALRCKELGFSSVVFLSCVLTRQSDSLPAFASAGITYPHPGQRSPCLLLLLSPFP